MSTILCCSGSSSRAFIRTHQLSVDLHHHHHHHHHPSQSPPQSARDWVTSRTVSLSSHRSIIRSSSLNIYRKIKTQTNKLQRKQTHSLAHTIDVGFFTRLLDRYCSSTAIILLGGQCLCFAIDHVLNHLIDLSSSRKITSIIGAFPFKCSVCTRCNRRKRQRMKLTLTRQCVMYDRRIGRSAIFRNSDSSPFGKDTMAARCNW